MFKLDFSKFSLDKIKSHKNLILLFLATLGIFITAVLAIDNMNIKISTPAKATVIKSMKYLNENILQGGQTADLLSFKEESGLIKIKIKIADKEYDSYVTKDGKLFFPEAINMKSQEDKIVAQ